MNKQQMIEAIHDRAGRTYDAHTSKKVVEAVLASLSDVTHAQLRAGEEVTLPGIGKLAVAEKAARKGHNPATGKEIDIPAKNAPKFSAAKALKDAVA